MVLTSTPNGVEAMLLKGSMRATLTVLGALFTAEKKEHVCLRSCISSSV